MKNFLKGFMPLFIVSLLIIFLVLYKTDNIILELTGLGIAKFLIENIFNIIIIILLMYIKSDLTEIRDQKNKELE